MKKHCQLPDLTKENLTKMAIPCNFHNSNLPNKMVRIMEITLYCIFYWLNEITDSFYVGMVI